MTGNDIGGWVILFIDLLMLVIFYVMVEADCNSAGLRMPPPKPGLKPPSDPWH